MDQNTLLSTLNHLYWFKDQVDDQEDYLKTLQKVADELELTGLSAEIGEYLLILENK